MITTPIGENAFALSVSMKRTSACVRIIRSLHHLLRQRDIPGILSIRPGLDTIIVEFEEGHYPDELISELQFIDPETFMPTNAAVEVAESAIRIPVCYEESYAIDLEHVCDKTELSAVEVVRLHSSVIYEVWMLGFMPGFPYLGELPERLQIARKKTPDQNIPAGSVAIAEEYSGIYPFHSPGGWHVIGRTPVRIVNYKLERPWLLEYGGRVQFYPISSTDFKQMRDEYETNND
jgi:inhibitor of KinA